MKYIEEEKTHEITVKILRNADMIEINTDKNPIILSRKQAMRLIDEMAWNFGITLD